MVAAQTGVDSVYWRTKAGLEVEFAVYGENIFFAIEVKNLCPIHPYDYRGLRAFREEYPQTTPCCFAEATNSSPYCRGL